MVQIIRRKIADILQGVPIGDLDRPSRPIDKMHGFEPLQRAVDMDTGETDAVADLLLIYGKLEALPDPILRVLEPAAEFTDEMRDTGKRVPAADIGQPFAIDGLFDEDSRHNAMPIDGNLKAISISDWRENRARVVSVSIRTS